MEWDDVEFEVEVEEDEDEDELKVGAEGKKTEPASQINRLSWGKKALTWKPIIEWTRRRRINFLVRPMSIFFRRRRRRRRF